MPLSGAIELPRVEGAYCGRMVSLSCGSGRSAPDESVSLAEEAFSELNLLEEGRSGEASPGRGSGLRGSTAGREVAGELALRINSRCRKLKKVSMKLVGSREAR